MSNDNPDRSRTISSSHRRDGMQVREGVLAVPGELKLHFGGALESVSIAWRLAGPAGAPVVVAIGGISASRRVWLPDEPRGGWWHEVVGAGPRARHAALPRPELRLPRRQRRFHRPARWRAVPDRIGLRPGRTTAAPHQSSRHRELARDRGCFVRRHGGAGVRRAFSGSRRAPHRHQRRGSRASDGERLARRAAAHRQVRDRDRRSCAAAWSSRARWPWPPIAARKNSRRVSPAPRAATPTRSSCCRSRNTCSRAAPNTRSVIGPASFVCLSESIDLHRVDAGRIFAPVTAIAVREDQLVPLGDMRAMVARLPNAELHEISSVYGHDAFLKENRRLAPIFANVLNDNPGTHTVTTPLTARTPARFARASKTAM